MGLQGMVGLGGTQEGSRTSAGMGALEGGFTAGHQHQAKKVPSTDLPSWDMPKSKIQPRRLQMLQLKSVVSGPGSRC